MAGVKCGMARAASSGTSHSCGALLTHSSTQKHLPSHFPIRARPNPNPNLRLESSDPVLEPPWKPLENRAAVRPACRRGTDRPTVDSGYERPQAQKGRGQGKGKGDEGKGSVYPRPKGRDGRTATEQRPRWTEQSRGAEQSTGLRRETDRAEAVAWEKKKQRLKREKKRDGLRGSAVALPTCNGEAENGFHSRRIRLRTSRATRT
jgi:hypothetical protein